jgi:magnesium transporter
MSASVTPLDALAIQYLTRHPTTAAQLVQQLDPDQMATILSAVPSRAAAATLAALGSDAAARIVKRLPPEACIAALAGSDPAIATALLRRLGDHSAQRALLDSLPATRRHEIATYLSYPDSSAGSLMDPAVPVFRADNRAGDVAVALRESQRRDEILMVVSSEGRLRGTVATVDVLLADDDVQLTSLRMQSTASVESLATRDEVMALLEQRHLPALPVVDMSGRPLGALTQRALAQVAEQDVVADMQAMVGASRDERALSSAAFAVKKRLPWLQVNLLTAFLAASVVGLFEDIIARFTALAVLLPVVAGQSGNTGAQALAVTMRGLTLHEIDLRHWLSVVMKEATVGSVTGLAVAMPTMLGVYVWSGSSGLTLVIGLSMVLSMTVAGIAGACVPLALRATGQDPAQSSSIVLTTVTDVTGFLSFLGIATVFARML